MTTMDRPMNRMDRPIDPGITRRRRVKIGLWVSAAALAAAGTLLGGRAMLTPSVRRSAIRIGRAEMGPVEQALTASGIVVPEREEVLSSPIDARVLAVLKRPGAIVAAGEPILTLDTNASVLALEKLNESVALKETQTDKARLDLEATLSSLKSQVEIKTLQLGTFEASLRKERREAQSQLSLATTRAEQSKRRSPTSTRPRSRSGCP